MVGTGGSSRFRREVVVGRVRGGGPGGDPGQVLQTRGEADRVTAVDASGGAGWGLRVLCRDLPQPPKICKSLIHSATNFLLTSQFDL